MLRPAYRVAVRTAWDGQPVDALIALHAGRSAASVRAFAHAHPERALIVVLTGTDLYGGLGAEEQRSLELASRLIVLNALGREALPARWQAKARLVLPSAPPRDPLAPRSRTFDVAVVGHLRAVKDPALPMRVARQLPPSSKIRVLHAGRAMEGAWSRAAQSTSRSTSRYRWLGAVPPGKTRALIRRSRLLLHPSRQEGGATVIVEALQSGVPVVASDCAGNLGLLGTSYPGLFPVGDADAAQQLLLRAETDARFYRRLQRAAQRRARLYAPAHERTALRSTLRDAVTRKALIAR